MILVGSILLPVQFDWREKLRKSGVRGILIDNLENSKKILSEMD